MRLHDFLQNVNGSGLSETQYRALKKRFPLVITNDNGEPQFKDRPRTRQQAINWLRNKRLVEEYEETHDVQGVPRMLLLIKKGVENLSIEDYLKQKFNIKATEIL